MKRLSIRGGEFTVIDGDEQNTIGDVVNVIIVNVLSYFLGVDGHEV